MPKLKNLLPNIFTTSNKDELKGRLETDALPVDDSHEENGNSNSNNNNNNNNTSLSISSNNTPSASAELTDSVVRELSDPNYNSMEVIQSATIPGNSNALVNSNNNNLMEPDPSSSSSITNTMNVHNAQQQVVMNFSNASNLHFGSVYNFNQNLSGINSQKNSCTTTTRTSNENPMPPINVNDGKQQRQTPRKTTTIVVMMQSQDEPNHRLFDTIATHLGEGWKQVMRELGHSEGQIEQAIIDHQMHGNIKEVIYQLLLQWQRNADDGEATVGRLTTLLWERNHRECVQRMKLIWKAQEKRKVSS